MTDNNTLASKVEKNNTIESINEKIAILASLDAISFEQRRDTEAKSLGIRVSKLDEMVKNARAINIHTCKDNQFFKNIEPWHDPVDLSDLLNEIEATLLRYVSFQSQHEAKAIALWVTYTYCVDAAYISPILFVTSPEMRSGKSTLLSILQKLTYKCIAASSLSSSSLFRIIDKYKPTILCDEADTYLTDKRDDLRGILNAGHSRDTSGVLRTNPDTLEPESFDSFGAKCIAAINRVPSTIEDRSIIIKMKRMHKGQSKDKLRLVDENLRSHFNCIQSKCLRFAIDNINLIKTQKPDTPQILNDRAADNWYILFQIVKLADSSWQNDAISSALHLSGYAEENKSKGIELLENISRLFEERFKDYAYILTADLIHALCEDEEAPWATYNFKSHNPRLQPRQLSKLLLPYGIKPINNVGQHKRKGYVKASFYDAFNRYISTHVDSNNGSALSAPNVTTGSMECNKAFTSNDILQFSAIADRAHKSSLNG